MDLQHQLWISFRIFKILEPDYHVYAIDLLGKGCSSRPEFLATNWDEAEEFFIQSIEEWRKTLNLTNFNLIGHSMGGYISAKYALRHHKHINKLILWSPLGVEPRPDNIKSYFISKADKIKCWKGWAYNMAECFAKNHCNYHSIFKWLGGWCSKWYFKLSYYKT